MRNTRSNLKDKLIAVFPDARGLYPEFAICCPFCTDKRYRLGLNLEKGVGHCFNCGKKIGKRGIENLLGSVEKKDSKDTSFEALEYFLDGISYSFSIPVMQRRTQTEIFLDGCYAISSIIESPHLYSGELLNLANEAIVYLRGRGFGDLNLIRSRRFMIPKRGSKLSGRVILPIYEHGHLVYYQARAINGQTPKYLNPSKKETLEGKSNFVYNLDTARRYNELVICEGIFSSLSVGGNAVAILGKELSDVQAFKICSCGFETIKILLDSGEDENAVKMGYKILGRVGRVEILSLKNGDPNEISKEELNACLNSGRELLTEDYSF